MFKSSFAVLIEKIQKNEKITPEIIDSIKELDFESELTATYKQLTQQEKEQLHTLSQNDTDLKAKLESIEEQSRQTTLK